MTKVAHSGHLFSCAARWLFRKLAGMLDFLDDWLPDFDRQADIGALLAFGATGLIIAALIANVILVQQSLAPGGATTLAEFAPDWQIVTFFIPESKWTAALLAPFVPFGLVMALRARRMKRLYAA